jgi:hypothetical protein
MPQDGDGPRRPRPSQLLQLATALPIGIAVGPPPVVIRGSYSPGWSAIAPTRFAPQSRDRHDADEGDSASLKGCCAGCSVM